MTKDKYKHAMEVIENWERAEVRDASSKGWAKPFWQIDDYKIGSLNNPESFRLKPTPSKVPFGPEDITSDMWIRFRNCSWWLRIDRFNHKGVWLSDGTRLSYEELAAATTYRRDGWPMERDEKCEKPSPPPTQTRA